VQLRTERGQIRAAFSVIGREFAGQNGDRANLDVQSIHGNVHVTVVSLVMSFLFTVCNLVYLTTYHSQEMLSAGSDLRRAQTPAVLLLFCRPTLWGQSHMGNVRHFQRGRFDL
jgi:hypothetical protein